MIHVDGGSHGVIVSNGVAFPFKAISFSTDNLGNISMEGILFDGSRNVALIADDDHIRLAIAVLNGDSQAALLLADEVHCKYLEPTKFETRKQLERKVQLLEDEIEENRKASLRSLHYMNGTLDDS